MDACRPTSTSFHNFSLCRISMFPCGSSWWSLTQSFVPNRSSSKKKEDAARREAYSKHVRRSISVSEITLKRRHGSSDDGSVPSRTAS